MWYENRITQERFNQLKEVVKEKQMKVTFRDFTVSEIEIIIDETPLTEQDKKIAQYKYIKKMTIEEILNRLDYYYLNTIKSHIKKISYDLRLTCTKLFI